MTPLNRVPGASPRSVTFLFVIPTAAMLFCLQDALGAEGTVRQEQHDAIRGPVPPESPSEVAPLPESSDEQPVPIRAAADVHHVVITSGADGRMIELRADAGVDPLPCHEREDAVYCNTLGSSVWGPSEPNRRIADDVVTAAEAGCDLDRYVIRVTGDKDQNGTGAALEGYTVTAALYRVCPGIPLSTPTPVPGTELTLAVPPEQAGAIVEITKQIPEIQSVPLPAQFYLGMTFNREKCGAVVGAPALKGFSDDRLDIPAWPCNGWLGGYPRFPHASIYAEIYTRGTCDSAYIGYRNSSQIEGPYSCGQNCRFADDVQLAVPGGECNLVAYEVAFRGAVVSFDLREVLDDRDPAGDTTAIPGTEGACFPQTPNLNEICRVEVDPPVRLDTGNLWITYRSGSSTLGPLRTCRDAQVGQSGNFHYYYSVPDRRWLEVYGSQQACWGGFDLTLYCEGPAPSGACCDTIFVDNGTCLGGTRDGDNCAMVPGGCPQGICVGDAVCRNVSQLNCILGHWLEVPTCGSDPFGPPCGVYACCKPDDTCENLTMRECFELAPGGPADRFQVGKFCGENQQRCPFHACVKREGDCATSHVAPGCRDPFCCQNVCEADVWCCHGEWDELCVREAQENCSRQTPLNDACYDADPQEGALLVESNSSTAVGLESATVDDGDPGFCCNEDDPATHGYGTAWFRFVATDTSARLHTCNSLPPADDSMIQVLRVIDPSTPETACATLDSIACSDDTPGCGDGRNSDVCVDGLIPGEMYYVLLAAKSPETRGVYRLDIESPCTPAMERPPNDQCHRAQTITENMTPFDLAGATLTCPPPDESCLAAPTSDLWYDWIAPCTGRATIHTCRDDSLSAPDTGLAVYEGCECPTDAARILDCDDSQNVPCSDGAIVTFGTELRQCYKVRLSGDFGARPAGNLTLNVTDCLPLCPSGEVTFTVPGLGVIDARQPHPPDDPAALQGIDAAVVIAPAVADDTCWTVSETTWNPSLHPPCPTELQPNEVAAVTNNRPDWYVVTLRRPLTPGETTSVVYTEDTGTVHSGCYSFLPGDVSADGISEPADIRFLGEILEGTVESPWALYSADLDDSRILAPGDLLRAVDLLNGAEAFAPGWNGASLPAEKIECLDPP